MIEFSQEKRGVTARAARREAHERIPTRVGHKPLKSLSKWLRFPHMLTHEADVSSKGGD